MAGLLVLVAGCLKPAPPPSETPPTPPSPPLTAPPAAEVEAPAKRPEAVPQAPELRAQAERLWAARKAEDWATLYTFLEPHQQTASLEEYAAWARDHEPFKVESYQLGQVLTDGRLGWVEINARLAVRRFPNMPARAAHRWDKWEWREQQWRQVPPRAVEDYPESPVTRDAAEEAHLRERFGESWAARRAADWEKLYSLVDPRDRERVPFEKFVDSEGLFEYYSHGIVWIEVIDDRGRIRVSYEHKLTDPSLTKLPQKTLEVTERWVKHEGVWYRDLVW